MNVFSMKEELESFVVLRKKHSETIFRYFYGWERNNLKIQTSYTSVDLLQVFGLQKSVTCRK